MDKPTKLQKNAPKILAVVLLLTILILLFVANSDQIGKAFQNLNAAPQDQSDQMPGDNNQTDPPGEQPPLTNDDDKPNNDPPLQEPQDPIDKDPDPVVVPKPTFPKASDQTQADYLFVQSLSVLGSQSAKAAFRYKNGTFVITEGHATGGDFQSEHHTTSVFFLDNNGTIQAHAELPTNGENRFLSANLTIFGLTVAVATKNNTVLFSVDEQLQIGTPKLFAPAQTANIFDTDDGYLLVLGQPNNSNVVFSVTKNKVIESSALPSGNIDYMVSYADRTYFLLDKAPHHHVVALDSALELVYASPIVIPKAIAFLPTQDGFLTAESDGSYLYLTQYTHSFGVKKAGTRVVAGNAARFFQAGSSTFLVAQTSLGYYSFYQVDETFALVPLAQDLLANINQIFGCDSYINNGYVLTKTDGRLTMLQLSPLGKVAKYDLGDGENFLWYHRTKEQDVLLVYHNDVDGVSTITLKQVALQ